MLLHPLASEVPLVSTPARLQACVLQSERQSFLVFHSFSGNSSARLAAIFRLNSPKMFLWLAAPITLVKSRHSELEAFPMAHNIYIETGAYCHFYVLG